VVDQLQLEQQTPMVLPGRIPHLVHCLPLTAVDLVEALEVAAIQLVVVAVVY